MSIHRISKDFFEVFSMLTHPSQSFSSGSMGLTGSAPIMGTIMSGVKMPDTIKTAIEVSEEGGVYTAWVDRVLDDELGEISTDIRDAIKTDTPIDKFDFFDMYLGTVNSYPSLKSQYVQFPITRSFPRYHLTKERQKLNTIKDGLIPHYRQDYTNCDYSYINYHCFNFFTGAHLDAVKHRTSVHPGAPGFPTGSVLIYPNMTGTHADPNPNNRVFQAGTERRHSDGNLINQPGIGDPPYIPQAGFTFEFYVNPKYTTDDPVPTGPDEIRGIGSHFRPGTIMHISSTFAISLMTGSSTDRYGYPDKYRILLQLTNSADIPPACFGFGDFHGNSQFLTASTHLKLADGGFYKHEAIPNFAFISSDNGLSRNNWHHVAIRWGTKDLNEGTGSIVIDGEIDSYFHTASLSSMVSIVTPVNHADDSPADGGSGETPRIRVHRVISGSDSDALFIGNFYEGSNSFSDGTEILRFFNTVSGSMTGVSASIGPGRLNPLDPSEKEDPVGYLKHDPIYYRFAHPLNAEIHDIRIYDGYRTLEQINLDRTKGPANFNNLLAYIPPFFSEQPRHRDHILRGPWFAAFAKAWSEAPLIPTELVVGGGKLSYPPICGGARMSSGTDAPFNTLLGYQNGALSISLENFTKELVMDRYPRLERLFETNPPGFGHSVEDEWTEAKIEPAYGDADDIYYRSPDNAKRNLTILPCDNGMFSPDYTLILTGAYKLEGAKHLDNRWTWGPPGGRFVDGVWKPTLWDLGIYFAEAFESYEIVSHVEPETFPASRTTGSFERLNGRMVNDLNIINPMYISLRKYVDEGVFINSIGAVSETISSIDRTVSEIFSDPDYPGHRSLSTIVPDLSPIGKDTIRYLPIYAANRDPDSNQVCWFDISNLYYGNRILPGSFNVRDIDLTGSNGKVQIRLRDDARGGIYRSDCDTPHATWNTVGNIFYDEGVMLIKSPHLSRFGKSQYEMSFKGENPIHVFTVNVPCPAGAVNVSSNATFTEFAPTMDANEEADSFVYITGVDMLDNNLNVVMRATLAQPMTKRTIDEFLFRLKMDF